MVISIVPGTTLVSLQRPAVKATYVSATDLQGTSEAEPIKRLRTLTTIQTTYSRAVCIS